MTFESDYTEGAHPKILQRLNETNFEQVSGYGADPFSESARQKIREACANPTAQITFISGGTQTNQIVIDSLLKPYEGVISAATGHISTHEAGAIEYVGHKVLVVPSQNGKLNALEVKHYIEAFYSDGNCEHMVFPGMVYISFPTEYGTLYTKQELQNLYGVCRKYQIPLFVDGARLGYALVSSACDVTLPELSELCDVFYIGGTKVGALCGEALVFTNQNEPAHFVNFVKKHGALLAKGRLLGIQFETLFTDDLYFKISRNAIEQAMFLKQGLQKLGYPLFIDSPTNQQFVVIENVKMHVLKQKVGFSFWEQYDSTHSVIRLATSWATRRETVEQLLDVLAELKNSDAAQSCSV